ncbi:MAG TPA: carboxypeptidase-like regulatory domain-containing protein, partial [Thermoplasmata archaeon]|nr:carboxypeptidase-like regulatory domain-containing protein [Thermoplasmata archaeon]
PLSGVLVTIVGTQRSTLTNINGEFTFTGLTSGNYTVLFVHDGFKPMEIGPVVITQESTEGLDNVLLEPVSEEFGGFIFGFDLAHSMMILALFLTIVILALAVVLRIRTFETPENAPAIFDDEDLEEEEGDNDDERPDGAEKKSERKVRDGEDGE